jgi:hypothetical protein
MNTRISPFLLGALSLAAAALTGCLNDAPARTGDAKISIQMALPDMDATTKGTLSKGSVIKLKKLIVTMTSNVVTDAIIRDTILASDSTGSTFKTSTNADQTFSKAYAIKPLRNWTVVVKTLDTRDSVIHRDSVLASNLLAAETRNITLNLDARYVMYEVKYSVPDSLKSNLSGQGQKLIITRVIVKIDSALAIDTSSFTGFAPAPVVHSSTYDYIPVNSTPDVIIRFYGHSVGTNDTLLFQAIIPNVDPEVEQPPVNAIYVGPGAVGGGGAVNNLIINIGKVNTITFNTNVNGVVSLKGRAK